MTDREEILKRMKKIEDYFLRQSSDNKSFEPELHCAKIIREKVGEVIQLTAKDADEILEIFNETNAGQHYNGSAWMDYQLHLRHLLTLDNLKIEIDNASGRMRLNIG